MNKFQCKNVSFSEIDKIKTLLFGKRIKEVEIELKDGMLHIQDHSLWFIPSNPNFDETHGVLEDCEGAQCLYWNLDNGRSIYPRGT